MSDDAVHDLILDEVRAVKSAVTDLKKQIFEGNGQASIVERLNKNTMIINVLIWCIGVIYTGFVGAIITVLIKKYC